MRNQSHAQPSFGREHTIIETAKYADAIGRAREFGLPWALIGNKLAEVVPGFLTERRKARRIMDRAIAVAKELEQSNVDFAQLEIPGIGGLLSRSTTIGDPQPEVKAVPVTPTETKSHESVASDTSSAHLVRPDSIRDLSVLDLNRNQVANQVANQVVEPEPVVTVRRDRAMLNEAEKLCLIDAKARYVDELTDELPPFGTGSDYTSILASDTAKVSIVAVVTGLRMGLYACLKNSTYANALNFDLLAERYRARLTGPRFPSMPPDRDKYDMITWAASPAIQSVLTEIIKEELKEWFESLPLSARYPATTTSVVRVP